MTPRLVNDAASARAAHSVIASPGVPGTPLGNPIPTRIGASLPFAYDADMTERPSITIDRRVHWFDTDTSTKEHNSAPLRWMEEAEAALLDKLGLVKELYGFLPRVHVTLDYRTPVRFWDELSVTVSIATVGRTSVTYDFDVRRDGAVAVGGRVVAVYVTEQGEPKELPDRYRRLLEGSEAAS